MTWRRNATCASWSPPPCQPLGPSRRVGGTAFTRMAFFFFFLLVPLSDGFNLQRTKVLVRVFVAAINPVDYKLPKLPLIGKSFAGKVRFSFLRTR